MTLLEMLIDILDDIFTSLKAEKQDLE